MRKDLKKFFSSYERDMSFDLDINDIKKKLTFNNNNIIKNNFSFKIIFSIFITFIIIAPSFFIIGYKLNTSNNINLSKDSNTLEKQFDSYTRNPIKYLEKDDSLISLYLARKEDNYYIIVDAVNNSLKSDLVVTYNNNEYKFRVNKERYNSISISNDDKINLSVKLYDGDLVLINERIILELQNYRIE